jgi:hypothetical protein
MLEVDQHTLFIGFTLHFYKHLVGVAVEIPAASFVPGKAMGTFPTESLGNFHGVVVDRSDVAAVGIEDTSTQSGP